MAKGDDSEERLIDFAVRILRLCEAMPKTVAARHLSGQPVCSGTSPAFNYGEARAAESRRDCVLCINKIVLVLQKFDFSKKSNFYAGVKYLEERFVNKKKLGFIDTDEGAELRERQLLQPGNSRFGQSNHGQPVCSGTLPAFNYGEARARFCIVH